MKPAARFATALLIAASMPVTAASADDGGEASGVASAFSSFFDTITSWFSGDAEETATEEAPPAEEGGSSIKVIDGSQAGQLMGAAAMLTPGGGLICSASQIAPQWVLTAKHCTEAMGGAMSVQGTSDRPDFHAPIPEQAQGSAAAVVDETSSVASTTSNYRYPTNRYYPSTSGNGYVPTAGGCPNGSCGPGGCPAGGCPGGNCQCPGGSCGPGGCPSTSKPGAGYPSMSNPGGGCGPGGCPSSGYPGTTNPSTNFPSYRNPGTTNPGCPNGTCPGGSCPGGSCPGTTNPGYNYPGTNRPGTTNPGCPNGTCPGGSCPGGSCPGTTNPGYRNPGTSPGTSNPGCPNGTCPGGSCPGGSCPGNSNPGGSNPGTPNPGTPNPGTSNPGGTNPGVTNPGAGTQPANGGGGRGYKVRLGSLSKTSGGVVVPIEQVYLPQTGGDIALLKLTRPVSDYPMVQLTSGDPQQGATVNIYGWGRTESNQMPDRLKTASMRYTGKTKDLRGGPSVDLQRGNGLANRGDSGGPALSGGVQVGVCSGSDFRSYSVYASVADHRSWIQSTAGV